MLLANGHVFPPLTSLRRRSDSTFTHLRARLYPPSPGGLKPPTPGSDRPPPRPVWTRNYSSFPVVTRPSSSSGRDYLPPLRAGINILPPYYSILLPPVDIDLAPAGSKTPTSSSSVSNSTLLIAPGETLPSSFRARRLPPSPVVDSYLLPRLYLASCSAGLTCLPGSSVLDHPHPPLLYVLDSLILRRDSTILHPGRITSSRGSGLDSSRHAVVNSTSLPVVLDPALMSPPGARLYLLLRSRINLLPPVVTATVLPLTLTSSSGQGNLLAPPVVTRPPPPVVTRPPPHPVVTRPPHPPGETLPPPPGRINLLPRDSSLGVTRPPHPPGETLPPPPGRINLLPRDSTSSSSGSNSTSSSSGRDSTSSFRARKNLTPRDSNSTSSPVVTRPSISGRGLYNSSSGQDITSSPRGSDSTSSSGSDSTSSSSGQDSTSSSSSGRDSTSSSGSDSTSSSGSDSTSSSIRRTRPPHPPARLYLASWAGLTSSARCDLRPSAAR
ncbi:hypothetical protein C7M84_013932 [Penaeus vannamei]|uniref:Uncharacterized protein n=1 Tax=Penaeus vannamei TaxID=6689 RepID=A0A3R7SN15_PENVA|nr:hypothetical protein C7M84_013932 [Penaeus vannamei]